MRRAVGSFRPSSMPSLSRAHYRREMLAWLLLPAMMGAVEGNVVAVIAKNSFHDSVPEGWLNAAVAVISGAPSFANIMSVVWAALAQGRHKIRAIVGLQLAAAMLIANVAFAPHSAVGLAMLTLGAVGAHVCWTGVVTLRATVWRANYPRAVRARLAGKIATVQTAMLAGVVFVIGYAMHENEQSFRLIYPIAASFGLAGAMTYGRMRMRGHAALLAHERRERAAGVRHGLRLLAILRDDARYRRYMIAMFILGIGNIAISAPQVIVLHDVFDFGYLPSILVTATIPNALIPFTIPFWSRLLDRVHVIRFRFYHCWTFVAANGCIAAAALAREPSLFWLGAVLEGVAFGGGVLGWNLGHHDFAPPRRTSEYMGVHVTLTGIRGLIGPPAIVALYTLLERLRPGSGSAVFLVCVGLSLAGAACFAVLAAREEGLDRLQN
jgi:hypothetical protein